LGEAEVSACATFRGLVAALLVSVAPLAQAAEVVKVPEFKLDTSWPKLPLPNHWALASIGGVYADAKDHIWIVHSPQLVAGNIKGAVSEPKRGICCVPAPQVIEFDTDGTVLRSWGGPGQGYNWPSYEHGIYIDYKGNVWIGGSETRVGKEGQPVDGMFLKFTQDGKFLMQIGGTGAPKNGSKDTTHLFGAAAVAVDPETNEVYVADGYGNHRVIVFDADTGKFKRMWGAYGKPPTDDNIGPYDPSAAPAKQFRIVHGIRISKDGLVYVSDRLNDRMQVFKKDGTFVAEYIYDKETRGSGSVGNVALWPDKTESFMAMNDPGNQQIRFVRRSDGAVLGTFGESGTWAGHLDQPHEVEFDSKGNMYTSEWSRVQKFVPVTPPAK
jgi:DNA-binding beta-propeller fold protein YncE